MPMSNTSTSSPPPAQPGKLPASLCCVDWVCGDILCWHRSCRDSFFKFLFPDHSGWRIGSKRKYCLSVWMKFVVFNVIPYYSATVGQEFVLWVGEKPKVIKPRRKCLNTFRLEAQNVSILSGTGRKRDYHRNWREEQSGARATAQVRLGRVLQFAGGSRNCSSYLRIGLGSGCAPEPPPTSSNPRPKTQGHRRRPSSLQENLQRKVSPGVYWESTTRWRDA